MLPSLDIPFELPVTTRRADRWVAALGVAVIAGALLGYTLSRIPFVIADTIGLQPKATIASVRFLKTASNVAIINKQFGDFQPLRGLPVSLRDFMRLSTHELSIHAQKDGNVAIALDTVIDHDFVTILEYYGYHAWVGEDKTLITHDLADVHDTSHRYVFRAISPWYDGDITLSQESEQRVALQIRSHQITIQGLGTPGSTSHNPSVPNGSAVLFATSIAENFIGTPASNETTESMRAIALLPENIRAQGASVVITQDEKGNGYFITIPTPDLSIEELAAVGKDLANRQYLSTTSWTIEDGEVYDEIRVGEDTPRVEINTEKDFTFITITGADGEVIRLTKTPDILSISNRNVGITDTVEPHSSCLGNAHTWTNTQAFNVLLAPDVNQQHQLLTLFGYFEEIAVSSGKIRLCW